MVFFAASTRQMLLDNASQMLVLENPGLVLSSGIRCASYSIDLVCLIVSSSDNSVEYYRSHQRAKSS